MALPIKNKIDLRSYVALGDSITAGYTDGALCYYGQQNSYPLLMAGQFKLNGGGDFKQPLIDKNSVGIGFYGNSCLILKNVYDEVEPGITDLCYISSQGDLSELKRNNFKTSGPFNNLGIPGAKSTSLLIQEFGNVSNGEGNYNPFFARMASYPEKASVLSDALALKPTFFSLFIGNNDALSYALSGGTANTVTPLFGTPGIGFEESFIAVINALTENGAKGVIANLPDVTDIPFFNAIPYNGLMLTENEISLVREKFSSCDFDLSVGKNAFIIESDTSHLAIRQMENGELVLLDVLLDKDKSDYLRGIKPIPKKYILTHSELQITQNAITSYNQFIKSIAKNKELAFVDANSLLKIARKDRIYNAAKFNFNYKKDGVFSLDGLHPNAYGQALLANEFIKEINETYSATIPLLDSNSYKQIAFP